MTGLVKALVALIVMLAAMTPARAAERVALVIGNARYVSAPRLANPANDAADVARALRDIGFDVVEGIDLDRSAMESKIRDFSRRLAGARMALFFYAGHGMQVAGHNYLVPVDAKLERPGDLALDTVDVHVVLQQMEAQKRVNLVFLDACRDNPLARSLARAYGTSRSAAVGQGLASIQSAIGTMIAFATQPDNVALDGSGRNSPFTTALLKHIRTPGLDIAVLMRRVRTEVIAATGERQVPWDHSSLTDSVVLVPGGAIAARAALPGPPGTAAATAAPQRLAALPPATVPRTPPIASPSSAGPSPAFATAPAPAPRTIATHTHYVNTLALSPDGAVIAVADRDLIVLRDAATGRELRRLAGHANALSVAFSPDGRTLASGGLDKLVRLWDVATGTVIDTFDVHRSEVNAVAFSPDGRQLASVGGSEIKVWDLAAAKPVVQMEVRGTLFQAVAWSPDGTRLASGDNSHLVRLWDARSGQVLRTMTGHRGMVRSVAFSPDGKRLASSGHDRLVKLWEVETGTALRTFGAHTDGIDVVRFSPDGGLLASGSRDRSIRLWRTDTGRPGPVLTGHTERVVGLAFAPDGHRLISAGSDRKVMLWSLVDAAGLAKQ